ncbi:MAG: alpha/beta hydrolase, partial [Beijerinckiaceae bacterium]
VAFSHRGFAPSDPTQGAPDPNDYADDLAALLDHLAIDRAVVVGQSMGGWTTVEFGLKHPQRLAGAVLACTTGSIDFAKISHPALDALPDWQASSRKQAEAFRHADIHVACGSRMAQENPALHELYKEIDRLNARLDKEAILNRLFAMRSRPLADLDRIPAHKLFIAGGEDIVIPACGVEAVARSAANARFVRVDDAGHSVYFERAARFNDAVDSFLHAIAYA